MPRTSASRFAVCAAACSLAIGCGGDGGGGTGPSDKGGSFNEVTRVSVAPTAVQVNVDATATLSATAYNATNVSLSKSFSWSSANATVATVDQSGTVRGVSVGTTTVTAEADGKSGSATVTVVEERQPTVPQGFQGSAASTSSAELQWSDADIEERYDVEREDRGTGGTGAARTYTVIATLPANTTSYNDTGLEPAHVYGYRVMACNANGCTASAEAEVETHGILAIQSVVLQQARVGEAYSATLIAAGGDGAYAWDLQNGSLPDGLTLGASTGVIAGTPTTAGNYAFTIRVRSAGQSVSSAIGLEVIGNQPVTINTPSLPSGTVGQPYAATLSASGGTGVYVWGVVSGSLPAGLTLNSSSGLISGTPTVVGTSAFRVGVQSGGQSATKDLSITIATVSCVAGTINYMGTEREEHVERGALATSSCSADGFFYEEWTLESSSADPLSILLRRDDDGLDPKLELYQGSTLLAASSSDARRQGEATGTPHDAAILVQSKYAALSRLPVGTYTIRVTSDRAGDVGGYRLDVRENVCYFQADITAVGSYSGEFTEDDCVIGRVSDSAFGYYSDPWRLVVGTGATRTVTFTRSTELETVMYISPQGSGYLDYEVTHYSTASLTHTFTEGSWVVWVANNWPFELGSYTLTVSDAQPPAAGSPAGSSAIAPSTGTSCPAPMLQDPRQCVVSALSAPELDLDLTSVLRPRRTGIPASSVGRRR